jgi:sugar lactone lactonase YvrE
MGTEVILELDNTYPTGIAFDSAGRMTWAELNKKRIVRSDPPYHDWDVVAELPQEAAPDGCAYTTGGDLVVATLFSGGLDVVSPAHDSAPMRLKWADDAVPTDCMFQGSNLWVTDARGFRDPAKPSGRLWRLETDVEGSELLTPLASASPANK